MESALVRNDIGIDDLVSVCDWGCCHDLALIPSRRVVLDRFSVRPKLIEHYERPCDVRRVGGWRQHMYVGMGYGSTGEFFLSIVERVALKPRPQRRVRLSMRSELANQPRHR